MAKVGIVCFEGAEELDFVGPWEVFAAAEALRGGAPVRLVAPEPGALRCAKGLTVVPDAGFADVPDLDVVVVPGGNGRRREMHNPAMLGFLRGHAQRGARVVSVCTGAFVLQAAGLLTGPATTHWMFTEELRALGVDVREGVRFVTDGRVATAAGVSAGIDLALWIVGEEYGEAFRDEVRRYIQYDPDPLR